MTIVKLWAAAAVAALLAACGSSVAPSSSSSQPPASSQSAPASSSGADRLDLTLAGTVSTHVTTVNGSPDCAFFYNDLNRKNVYRVKFTVDLGTESGEFSVLINDADSKGRTYRVAAENVAVDGADAGKLHWSSFGGSGATGTVTVKDDRSGSIQAVLPSRSGGAALNGDGTTLSVRGSWQCANFSGG